MDIPKENVIWRNSFLEWRTGDGINFSGANAYGAEDYSNGLAYWKWKDPIWIHSVSFHALLTADSPADLPTQSLTSGFAQIGFFANGNRVPFAQGEDDDSIGSTVKTVIFAQDYTVDLRAGEIITDMGGIDQITMFAYAASWTDNASNLSARIVGQIHVRFQTREYLEQLGVGYGGLIV